jgi:flagellin
MGLAPNVSWPLTAQPKRLVRLLHNAAQMSRFDFVSANLATSVENIDAARSTLMDVDVAAEMANYSSKQVVMQASVAMLAQANQMPQNLLRLMQ